MCQIVEPYYAIALIYSVIKCKYEHLGPVSVLVTTNQLPSLVVVQCICCTDKTVIVILEKCELSGQVKTSS